MFTDRFLPAAQEGWDAYQAGAHLLTNNPYEMSDQLFWEDLRMMTLVYRVQGYPEDWIQKSIERQCQELQGRADGWGCGLLAASLGYPRPQAGKPIIKADQEKVNDNAFAQTPD